MKKIGPLFVALSVMHIYSCRTTPWNSSEQKGVDDLNLATCRVVELDEVLFGALKDKIVLESIVKKDDKPTEVQKVQVVKPTKGPTTMQIGSSILSNATQIGLDDATKQAFSANSLHKPIGYLLMVDAKKFGTLSSYETAQLRFGHRPQDISKVFAKLVCH